MSSLLQNKAKLQEILDTVVNLPAGGGSLDTSDATATSSDIVAGATAYVNGTKITGIIPKMKESDITVSGNSIIVHPGYYAGRCHKSVNTESLASPSVSIDNTGLITASITQPSGYITSVTTKAATKQLTTQAAKTITPSTSSQTAVASGVYTTGAVTVAGDANLKAENIAEGVSIFGVEGAHTGGVDTSDATASADEIMSGETAYVNGSKITGTFSIDSELTAQDDLIAQIIAALESKFGGGGADIITFTIDIFGWGDDIVTYQAEEGMTWGELVASEYNTDGYFVVSGNWILTTDDLQVYDINGHHVTSEQEIISGYSYPVTFKD